MTSPQKNKWCLILGVSSGIGKATAESLSKEGWNIFGVHLDMADQETRIAELKFALQQNNVQVHFFNKNADNRKAREEIINDLKDQLGTDTLDLLVHSLAFGTLLPFIKTAENEDIIQKNQMEMTLSVMAHSLVYWTQDLWHQKLLAKGAKIFAMTSGGSVMHSKNYGAVSAAKSALESHARQLAIELAPHGVMVNCLRAGITNTPALRKIPEHEVLLQRAKDFNPHCRLSTVEDIGNAICSLTKMPGSWMTGNVINIDGGEILTI